jgi:hypothetical protein
MLKITGLDKIQRELSEAEAALGELDGELGTVNFNPNDPSSIEAAIQSVYQMIELRVGKFASNSIVGTLIEDMKESYREDIIERAATARLESKGSM